MRRRFREAIEVREIKEAQRPGNSYQQHMAADGEDINPFAMLSAIADGQDDLHAWKEEREDLDPLEMKDTIEDDEPEDEYDLEEEKVIDPLELKDTIEDDPDELDDVLEETSEEDLWWEKQLEKDAANLRGEIQAPEMDEDTESIEAFEKEQTKGKERTAGLEDKER